MRGKRIAHHKPSWRRPVRRSVACRSLSLALLLAAAAPALQGCFIPAAPILLGATTAAELTYDKKTLPDVAVSMLMEKDCSLLRYEQGGEWCVDPNALPPLEPPLYCYRTIGTVDCYPIPQDPYGTRPLPQNEAIPAP